MTSSEVFHIKQDRPTIGEIIKDLRTYRKMTQEDLAQATFSNKSTICQIERGNSKCSDNLLRMIKTALDVKILPLFEAERSEFRDMLYKWYNAISARDWDTAKELQEKLSVIKLLPDDKEFNRLYSVFECRLLLGLNELDAAKRLLAKFETELDELSDIQLYHHYYNQGTYNSRVKNNQAALNNYLKANALIRHDFGKNTLLYYNIAICYERLGNVALAATYLEVACELYPITQNNAPEFSLYNSLGMCYISTGHLQRAKMTLDKAHTIALSEYKTISNDYSKVRMGMVLSNYGYLFRMAKKWNSAIEYLDKALDILDKNNVYYLKTLYQKALVLIAEGDTLSCHELLEEGVKLSKDSAIQSAEFKALELLVNLNDDSARYIETEILPFLIKNNCFYTSLDFAMVLRDFLKGKEQSNKIRTLEISDIICTILMQMSEGGVVE